MLDLVGGFPFRVVVDSMTPLEWLTGPEADNEHSNGRDEQRTDMG
jgi:hypothetical protein